MRQRWFEFRESLSASIGASVGWLIQTAVGGGGGVGTPAGKRSGWAACASARTRARAATRPFCLPSLSARVLRRLALRKERGSLRTFGKGMARSPSPRRIKGTRITTGPGGNVAPRVRRVRLLRGRNPRICSRHFSAISAECLSGKVRLHLRRGCGSGVSELAGSVGDRAPAKPSSILKVPS
jgi:hypothetical protein